MPLIILNGIKVNGRINSSLPSSYVSLQVASHLGCLDKVSVNCPTIDPSIEMLCTLPFSTYDKLMSDCVLGLDFLCGIVNILRMFL
jgi:hypothetical protein